MNVMKLMFFILLFSMLNACSSTNTANQIKNPSPEHLRVNPVAGNPEGAPIPSINRNVPYLPKPKVGAAQNLYSLSVVQAPIREVLFKLARDAKLEINILDDVNDYVTINLIDEPLAVIVDRLNEQANVRITLSDNRLVVQADTPYWVNYPIDYVNLDRYSSSSILLANAVGKTNQSAAASVTLGAPSNQPQVATSLQAGSSVAILNRSKHEVWKTLGDGVMRVMRSFYPNLGEAVPEGQQAQRTKPATAAATASAPKASTPTTSAAGSGAASNVSAESLASSTQTLPTGEQPLDEPPVATGPYPDGAPVSDYVNIAREAGFIGVYTTRKAHAEVQKYIDSMMNGSRRQVMIEATVVEVALNEENQSGINWSNASLSSTFAGSDQLDYTSSNTAGALSFKGSVDNPSWSLATTLKLLGRYGNSQVLSSPKIVGINNQPTVLKVVKNLVYFTTTVTPGTSTATGTTPSVFSTTPNTVPVGLVLSVLPSINENDQITLVVRPTISSLTGYAEDPNPAFKDKTLTSPITSLIPVIQEREMESVLKLNDGQVAVLGGLIQDGAISQDTGVPGLVTDSVAGYLFGQKNSGKLKSELVIFLRPVLIKHPDIEKGDFSNQRYLLERVTKAPSSSPLAVDSVNEGR